MNQTATTKRKHVKGSLFAANKEAAANPFSQLRLYYAFREMGLGELVDSEGDTWSGNHITFETSSPTSGTREEALEFIENLNTVINSDGAKELELHGRFSLVLEAREEPLVFRVEVKNGKVSYQQAEYNWPEAITV